MFSAPLPPPPLPETVIVVEEQRLKRQCLNHQEDRDPKSRKLDSIYTFRDINISLIIDDDDNTWFKAVDLARALEMEDPHNATSALMNKKYCKSYKDLSLSRYGDIQQQQPKTTFVNEIGANIFIISSQMPRVEDFLEWIYDVVLKSIRNIIINNNNKNENDTPPFPHNDMNEFLKKQNEGLIKQNEGLIKRNEELINDLRRYTQQLFEMKPSCVPKLDDEKKQEYFVLYKKNSKRYDPFPYYACRVQLHSLKIRRNDLLLEFPNLAILLQLSVPNSVTFFNYILEQMPKFIKRSRQDQSFRINIISEEQMLTMIQNLHRTLHHQGEVMKNILEKKK